jgi:hypothetical protein
MNENTPTVSPHAGPAPPGAAPNPLDLALSRLAERAQSPRVQQWANALLERGERYSATEPRT